MELSSTRFSLSGSPFIGDGGVSATSMQSPEIEWASDEAFGSEDDAFWPLAGAKWSQGNAILSGSIALAGGIGRDADTSFFARVDLLARGLMIMPSLCKSLCSSKFGNKSCSCPP